MGPGDLQTLGLGEVGRNVRELRLRQGIDQEALAAKAGVSSRTVRRVEGGRGVRAGTLARICEALGWDATQARTSVRFLYSRGPEAAYRLHRPEDAVWYAEVDWRKKPPADAFERMQDPEERRRLGRLGLVPMFVGTLRFNMPGGPGIAFFEVYGRWSFAAEDSPYRERFLYCLRGEVRFDFEGESVGLTAGSGINVGRVGFGIEPDSRLEGALLMHVGAGWVRRGA